MRILHTSDWHVGKVLKGRTRLEEHIARARPGRRDRRGRAARPGDRRRRPLRHGRAAARRDPGGDPGAVRAAADRRRRSSRSAATTTTARRWTRCGPWADAAGITLRGAVGDKPDDLLITGDDRRRRALAAGRAAVPLPALRGPRRGDVRADRRRGQPDLRRPHRPADRPAQPRASPSPALVNLLTAHLTVVGASTGGGEREAHTVMGYAVPATVFPTNAHYVALGHLHRAQQVIGPCPVRYCGSPLAVDFGEEENVCSVAIVDVSADKAARVRDVPVTSALTAAYRARHPGAARHGASCRTPGCGSSSGRRPGSGCARTCRSCCRTRWRCGSTRTWCPTRRARRWPSAPGRSPAPAVRRLPGPAAAPPRTASANCSTELYDEVEREPTRR